MSTRYASVHNRTTLSGPGDARPTALQIISDENLTNALSDKTILITGVSSGIGVETLRALHATGAHCIGTVRSLSAGQSVVSSILASNPNGGAISLVEIELGSLDSVHRGAAEILRVCSGDLNIMICNAGIMAPPLRRTKDGNESQFGVNHLSHFLLFNLLTSTLLSSATPEFPSRVVTVSSLGHRESTVRLHDPNFLAQDGNEYNKWLGYGSSKTANIWMANYITRHYSAQHLHGISLHPGLIFTNLSREMSEEEAAPFMADEAKRVSKSVEQGAATSVLVAVGKEWRDKGGVWVSDCQIQEKWDGKKGLLEDDGYAEWAFDEAGEEELWRVSREMVGLKAGE